MNVTTISGVARSEGGVVFTFSGQGSYSHQLLRDLYTSYPQTWTSFHLANEISRRFLDCEFLPLVTAATEEQHDEWLKSCPDLDQIGIYLGSVLTAQILIESGRRPDLLVGHSFGELAALATAGVYSVEEGLRIVCQRVIALQALADAGRMAALSCDYERAKGGIAKLEHHSIEISVLNHPQQTVVSGPAADLKRLAEVLVRDGVLLTVLKSRYPYHSSHLRGAVKIFGAFLKSYDFKPAAIPMFLSMEGTMCSPGCDLPWILSSQFVRPLNFSNVVATIYAAGYRQFVECGGADVITRIVKRNLAEKLDVTAQSTADAFNEARHHSAKSGRPPSPRTEVDVSEHKAPAEREQPPVAVLQQARTPERILPAIPAPPSADRKGNGVDGPTRLRVNGAGDPGKASVQHGEKQRSNARSAGESSEIPIAIVSMGCVLPGANNPEQYWTNVMEGRSGIVNLAHAEPGAARDFLVGDGNGQATVVPDKTYTLLHGSIVDVPYDPDLLSGVYEQRQFSELSKGQRMLALAIAQSLSRLKSDVFSKGAGRIHCVLGSTADGCKEYDEALFNESLQAILAALEEPEHLRRPFARALEEITGYRTGASKDFTQYRMYRTVVEKFLRHPIRTYVIDAACSSSLYSICLGMKALQDGEFDVVLSGGVFAPGPANNTLFAQFRGLTPRESRPFDAAADGVVFGDGAGVVILKRLPEALADHDEILGVIRGVGLSSDGKSPSINVPRSDGQAIAIRRAYERAGVNVDTIQYIEAHATATPVGDAVEFNALKHALSDRNPELPAVQLGSVKALIGHTGWTAGVASVIKLCKAFESRVIPKQYHYAAPNSEIDLAHSPFAIAQFACPWPDNIDGAPLRAGINGFGFGGTNAHLILEAFDPEYHGQWRDQPTPNKRRPADLALVGIGSLFPEGTTPKGENASPGRQFERKSLRMPAGKMLLPDVTEHMDASQYLAGMAAEALFATMPKLSPQQKKSIGIVLGLESKTERGVAANERIFVDRLRRKFSEHTGKLELAQVDADRVLSALIERIQRRNPPSGPYTLPGLMPNVAAGRIANLFDLNGPNVVVDMGGQSLLQAVWIARQLLSDADCDLALAGGISANGRSEGGRAEAALLMALTTAETARREGWPVLGTLTLRESDEEKTLLPVPVLNPTLDYCGASGAPEIAWVLQQLRAHPSVHQVMGRSDDGLPSRSIVFSPIAAAPKAAPAEIPPAGAPTTYAYVQGTPITCYAPHLMAAAAADAPMVRTERRILFLTDQPDAWAVIEKSGALAGLKHTVICPANVRVENAVPIDLSGEEAVRSSLAALAGTEYDTLIAVKSLKKHAANTLLVNSHEAELTWLELLFAICRHDYERIQDQRLSVATLCFDMPGSTRLDPYTGLVAGFVKSLARELPDGVCRIVNTDTADFRAALQRVEVELGQPASGALDEVHYLADERHIVTLVPVADLTKDEQPYLDSGSVVIATGGGRGVTAALAEQLLKDFGCRVIAVGRTDPSSVPDDIRRMDERALQNYEAEFYQDQFRRDKRAKIPDLKRTYLSYRAANEIYGITQRLQTIGNYEYRCVDLTDETAAKAFVESVYRDHGRVDLVLHGAGVQVSKALAKKSLQDFRRVVAAKLSSLNYLYRACEAHRQTHDIHYHLLTSAFSYMGNDGQCDYGAANEAMNRLAVAMNAAPDSGHWSSLAWLGWAGVGMTRDSEFAALAANRGLRGVTRAEGQELFSALMKGTPTTAANILLAPGEIDYYKVRIETAAPEAVVPATSVASAMKSEPEALVVERSVSIQTDPYLASHLVDGIPTVPGAKIIALVADAAHKLRPDLKIVSFERATFHRFIKVYGTKETPFRVHATVVSEDDDETVVHVRLVADFVHRSGVILQRDVLQHEIDVRMAETLRHPSTPRQPRDFNGRSLPDPYVMSGSLVNLSGMFDTMRNITVGTAFRRADYKLSAPLGAAIENGSPLPAIMLMDSLWRFAAIDVARDRSLPVYVPEKCELMNVYFDFAHIDRDRLLGTLTLSGSNPRGDGDALRIGPVAAYDVAGNVLLSVEGGLCRRFGEVRNEYAFQATGS